MAEGFEIDLDGEQVLFDGTWYSKEELARKLKSMVDAGDYRLSRPSSALETLQNALTNLRTLSVRLPAALAEALAANAARQGMPVGAFVRNALASTLNGPAPSRTSGAGHASPVPMVLGSGGSTVFGGSTTVTEPASADEAAAAIPLTPKRKEDNDPAKDWFSRK